MVPDSLHSGFTVAERDLRFALRGRPVRVPGPISPPVEIGFAGGHMDSGTSPGMTAGFVASPQTETVAGSRRRP
ncbi:hypothetical protein JOD31_001156 [Methylopila capsulata]|uniref:Uncharacterized protein n=1 Tax=Methylopila capsulata TaxID=61654 RepID=A0A9W6IR20_9HYPH|nr:hypothetical protein [Methylopila capsulata]GLK53989.1 hypothetical protein GCM10008170_00080 [Methylopila capsulata]